MDVKRTVSNIDKLMERMEALTGQEVLVGIPAENTGRKDDKQPITNASLAYIHEFGSPAHNIPERPFLRPGVRNAREEIARRMRKGATDVLHGSGAGPILNGVGLVARNSVVRAITDPAPPFVPLKYATIRARLRRTKGGQRKLKKFDQIKRAAGWSGADAAAAMQIWGTEEGNIRPLIDTGQLRAAITYVVRPARRPGGASAFGFQRDYGNIVTKLKR